MGGHRRVGQREESRGGVVGGRRESRWRKKATMAAFEVAEAAPPVVSEVVTMGSSEGYGWWRRIEIR
jgi:hypothetical protein